MTQSIFLNCYCFPFFVNNEGDYVSFYIQDKNGNLYTTRETSDVYRTRQSFIYECLEYPENREIFHQMIKRQLEKRCLQSEITEREDVMMNTIGTRNKVNQ